MHNWDLSKWWLLLPLDVIIIIHKCFTKEQQQELLSFDAAKLKVILVDYPDGCSSSGVPLEDLDQG